jgi:hypothetical protein
VAHVVSFANGPKEADHVPIFQERVLPGVRTHELCNMPLKIIKIPIDFDTSGVSAHASIPTAGV